MTKPPSPRPLSIKIIAIFYLVFGGFVALLNLLLLPVVFTPPEVWEELGRQPAPFRLGVLIWAVVHLVVGIGLWRLHRVTWYAALAMEGLRVATMLLLRPLQGATYHDPGFLLGSILGFAWAGFAIWFLIKHKSAFVTPHGNRGSGLDAIIHPPC